MRMLQSHLTLCCMIVFSSSVKLLDSNCVNKSLVLLAASQRIGARAWLIVKTVRV